MHRTNGIRMIMMMVTMTVTVVSMTVVCYCLSMGFMTIFFLLSVAVAMGASRVFVVISEMGMFVEESHADNINDKANDGYDDHLTGVDNRGIINSLKGFNEDIEPNEYQEDTIDKAREGLESIKSIGELAVSRESCLVRCVYTYCEGCGIEEHVGGVREKPNTVG